MITRLQVYDMIRGNRIRYNLVCAYSEISNQFAHPKFLISLIISAEHWLQRMPIEDFDHNAQMRRVI